MNKIVRIFNNTITFLTEVKAELKNVTWPNKEETVGSTWVVLIAVVLIGTFIWIVDIILQKMVTLVL